LFSADFRLPPFVGSSISCCPILLRKDFQGSSLFPSPARRFPPAHLLLRRPVCFVFCAEERAQSFFLDFPLLPFVDFYFWIAGGLL
jgi:hypothetical protein